MKFLAFCYNWINEKEAGQKLSSLRCLKEITV